MIENGRLYRQKIRVQLERLRWSYFLGPLIDILIVYSTTLFARRSASLQQGLEVARDRLLPPSQAAPGVDSKPRPSNLYQESLAPLAAPVPVACSTSPGVQPASGECGLASL